MKLLIFASVNLFKTLILLKVLESLNSNKQLLCLATKVSYFIFNGFLYKQIDGVVMGSPLGSSLANAFLPYHETGYAIFHKDLSQFFTVILSIILFYSSNGMIT